MRVIKLYDLNTEEYKHKLILSINAGTAEVSPALGTVLGNIGLNTNEFCKQFNDRTNMIPSYFRLIATINVSQTNKFSFTLKAPSTGSILRLLTFERTIKVKRGDKYIDEIIQCIN